MYSEATCVSRLVVRHHFENEPFASLTIILSRRQLFEHRAVPLQH